VAVFFSDSFHAFEGWANTHSTSPRHAVPGQAVLVPSAGTVFVQPCLTLPLIRGVRDLWGAEWGMQAFTALLQAAAVRKADGTVERPLLPGGITFFP
jgi:hypothetical protein